jgi:hypothetical protein
MRSTTFVFKSLSTSIQNFGVNFVQTEAQQNQIGQPRHAQPEVPPTEVVASLGTYAPTCLVFSRVRVASPPRRTRAAHRADRRSDPRVTVRASVETSLYHGGISALVTPPSSPVHRPTYKRRQGLPAGEHRAAKRHCRPRAELGPFPHNRVDPPPSDRP